MVQENWGIAVHIFFGSEYPMVALGLMFDV